MAEAIRQEVARFFAGEPPPPPTASVVERYEYGKLAGDLAQLFGAVLAARQGATNQP
jgi:hypothetical protein